MEKIIAYIKGMKKSSSNVKALEKLESLIQKQIQNDYEFLKEMEERLGSAVVDATEWEMVEAMIGDWKEELERLTLF